jgi:hypothetical protein
MFCTKCGKEMKDNEIFCTRCGAKREYVHNNGDIVTTHKKLNSDNKNKFMNEHIIAIVLMFINGIFLFTKTFKIDILWASEGIDIFSLMDKQFLKPIMIIIYILAIIIMIIPLIKKQQFKQIYIIPAEVVISATLLLFIIVCYIGKKQAEEYYADFSFTVTGVFLLVVSIVNFILLFKMILQLRKDLFNA